MRHMWNRLAHVPTVQLALPRTSRPGGIRPRMRDDTGAQAAEYAMLGGVSAAACGGLVALLREPDTLRTVLEAVLGTIGGFVGSWF